ncbi:hypothetical protein VaNZ11_006351, partial [Volvox africanus]
SQPPLAPPPPSLPPPSPPPPDAVCEDRSSVDGYCEIWRDKDYCDGFTFLYEGDYPCPSIKDFWCPKTCGACGIPPPTPSLDPKIGGCDNPDATLARFNYYRARHSAPPLVWNNTLASHALSWVTQLAAWSCTLEHEYKWGEGENLFNFWHPNWNPPLDCAEAVDLWYEESVSYKYTDTPAEDNSVWDTGHFMAVVWAETTEVGCAAARGHDCHVISCRFYPQALYLLDDCLQLKNLKPPIW